MTQTSPPVRLCPEDCPILATAKNDAWMAKRAEEAARPKTEQQQPK